MSAISSERECKPSARQAMLVFGAGVSAALHIWKLPPALPVLQETLGLTLSQAGWLISVFQVAGMLMGLAFGLFVQRIGQKRSILFGLIILSLASFAGAFSQSVIALLLFRIIEGFALLMVSMAAPSLMRQVAPKERLNFFVALWSAYIPTATVIALFVGAAMLNVFSWVSLWVGTGLISLLMALLVWRSVTDTEHPAATRPVSGEAWQSIKETLAVKEPWLVAICFSLYTGQWVAIISFLPIIYHEAGISGPLMGTFTAVAAGVNIIGNLMAGRLLQRGVAARSLLMVAFSTMIVTAFIAFGLNVSSGVQFVAITLFSAVGGLAPATLFNLAVKVSVSPRTIPITIGWQQHWISFGQFAGPIIVAFVVDYTHGWQWVWVLTSAWGALGIVLALVLCRAIAHKPA
ncbi:MFS transporter [Enterobacillus tribolii]|uniref:Putative MFS family arabinose efflux permease n=1 Tax=Enterobacillus tribolii TaxID=1487935 RepID=A0A370QQK8_9GAMM|nr:MFS transporter [Enterobacillus tribolii]MBW7981682.1 MFS transporter [Enterobacillus tribolii]RDK91061.1 putative MFS family arabinose efflux permease [Enterobacillus tribolii]